jgi:hypothetical protein
MSAHVHRSIHMPNARATAVAAIVALALAAAAWSALSIQPTAANPAYESLQITQKWAQDPNSAPPGIWVAPSGGPVGTYQAQDLAPQPGGTR